MTSIRPWGHVRTTTGRGGKLFRWCPGMAAGRACRASAPAAGRGPRGTLGVRIAHVRERHAPAGAPGVWPPAPPAGPRQSPGSGSTSRSPGGAAGGGPASAPTTPRSSGRPIRTLDDHLAAGLRVAALGRDRRGVPVARAGRRRGPRRRRPRLRPADPAAADLRDFYAFEGHVGTMWARRGGEIPRGVVPAAGLLLLECLRDPRPRRAVWAPRGSAELDFELEVCAVVDTPARISRRGGRRRRSAATASSTTGRRGTSSATRRRSASGRPRARTSRARSGRGSSRPDELADARAPGRDGAGPAR